eukprot:TRINITY_DN14755_c0_g3_i2.p1 TRINITY_DN14755_c0_g3~~TRINITY_DN14755_c0_g3_i2.p1  ORF type:complete len:315 (+),score=64.40 TRINITY_DN14755_c0_g3_i2:164-1108(+)
MKASAMTELKPSKICSLIDDIYRFIHTRYEDTKAIEALVAKNKGLFGPDLAKALAPFKTAVYEIERKESLRRDLEKGTLVQLSKVQAKKGDKVLSYLQKMIVKTLAQIGSPGLAFRLPKVPLSVHVLNSLNNREVGRMQKDEITGKLLKGTEKPCSTIELLTKFTLGKEESVYQILYYAVVESRRRIDEYLIFFKSSLYVSNKPEATLETLIKINANIAKSIEANKKVNNKGENTLIDVNLNKDSSSEISRGEKLLQVLEAEFKGQSNNASTQANKIKLSMMLDENIKEPSQLLLDSYIAVSYTHLTLPTICSV